MRRVFDDKDIEAVTFATPNHWHALGSIWAAQAGKNVYCEKPACHNVWEGRQMVNAARKHKVAMQVGFQNRSRKKTIAAMKLLHEGKLGKIYKAKGLCFKPRDNIGATPTARWPRAPAPPDGEEPAALHGLVPREGPLRHLDGAGAAEAVQPEPLPLQLALAVGLRRWRHRQPGPHQFDVGRWGLNKEEYPVKVHSSGRLFLYEDSQQETPNEQTIVFEYADGTIFEFGTRGLPTNAEGGMKIGNIFYGSEGRLEIDADGNWKTFMGPKDEPGVDSKNIKDEDVPTP